MGAEKQAIEAMAQGKNFAEHCDYLSTTLANE
jgi:hypothetical protein